MASFSRDHGDDQLPQLREGQAAQTDRLETARKIALESLEEDHHALEVDAKLSFGTFASLAR